MLTDFFSGACSMIRLGPGSYSAMVFLSLSKTAILYSTGKSSPERFSRNSPLLFLFLLKKSGLPLLKAFIFSAPPVRQSILLSCSRGRGVRKICVAFFDEACFEGFRSFCLSGEKALVRFISEPVSPIVSCVILITPALYFFILITPIANVFSDAIIFSLYKIIRYPTFPCTG